MGAHLHNLIRLPPYYLVWIRYELCNEIGLYVIDEANIETHGFDPSFANNEANPACWPEWMPAMLDRVVRMHERCEYIIG
jgi:beta-galactosidase